MRNAIRIAVATAACAAASSAAAIEGPVVFGGDNFATFGALNTTTSQLEDGWLAMQRELAYVAPKVGRFNDNSVAVVGARPSAAITADAGAAIGRAAATLGLPVTYHDGGEAINTLFADLRSGAAKPRVLWIPGNSAVNSLDTAELAALGTSGNDATLAAFVGGGGGLIVHGDEAVYAGWLARIAPGLTPTTGAGLGLALTPAGATILSGVTPASLAGSVWRSGFVGNLNELRVLATATDQFEADGVTTRKVVLAGGREWTTLSPANLRITAASPSAVDRRDVVRYELTVTNDGPNLAAGTVVTHNLPSKLAFQGGTGGPGRTCVAGPPVTCAIGDLPPGASAVVVVFAKAIGAGLITTQSRATSQVPDEVVADNATARTLRALTTGLKLTVSAPGYGHGRDLMRVRVEVSNTGKRPAKQVVLRIPAPNGLTLERRPPGARAEGSAAVWDLGIIRPGKTKRITFRIRVNDRSQGPRCIPARVGAANVNPIKGRDCVMTYLRHATAPGPHRHVSLEAPAPQ